MILEQVAAAAQSARRLLADRVAHGRSLIAENVQEQKKQITNVGSAQSQRVRSLFASAHGQLGEIIAGAQTKLQADAEIHHANLAQWHAEAVARAGEIFASRQDRIRNVGESYAGRVIEAGNRAAEQARSKISASAAEARRLGAAKSRVGGSTTEIAQAKAKVAVDLAQDTASKIESGISDLLFDLGSNGPETAQSYRQKAQEAAAQLGEGLPTVTQQLGTARLSISGGIEQALLEGQASLSGLQIQLAHGLSSAEQELHAQLHEQLDVKSQELDSAGHLAGERLQREAEQAASAGDARLTHLNQRIAGMVIDPAKAPDAATTISSQINVAHGGLLGTVESAFHHANAAISKAGGDAVMAINSVSPRSAGQVHQLVAQARGQANRHANAISSQIANGVSHATTQGTASLDQVAAGIDTQVTSLEQTFSKGLADYQAGLDKQVTDGVGKAHEPVTTLGARIDQAQARVEEQAHQGWLRRQLGQLWDMLSDPGFWVALGVGLVLVVLAIFLLPEELGLLAILGIAAAIGAIAAGVGTIVSNIYHGRPWYQDVLKNMLIGAVFGAALAGAAVLLTSVFGFAVGSLGFVIGMSLAAGIVTVIINLVTGRPWDEGLLANMLFAGLFAWLSKFVPRLGPKLPPEEVDPTKPVVDPTKSGEPVEPEKPSAPVSYDPSLRTDVELGLDTDPTPRGTETPEQAQARSDAAKAEQARRGALPVCFVAGTLVQTPNGPIPIDALARGQFVLARGEDQAAVDVYRVVDCMRGLTQKLYHIEVAGTQTLTTTRNHPFFVLGKGWTIAKELVVGDKLLELDGMPVPVTAIDFERLGEPVATFNIQVEGVSNYFVGRGIAVWVHNADPKDPKFGERLYWGLGAKGPRQRMPRAADPDNPKPKLRDPDPGDIDGASAWRTDSPEEVGRFLGARKTIDAATGNHGAFTEAQLGQKDLIAVETPGEGAPAGAGVKHVSIRPKSNPDPSVPLSEAEMAKIKSDLESLEPLQAKPRDFGC